MSGANDRDQQLILNIPICDPKDINCQSYENIMPAFRFPSSTIQKPTQSAQDILTTIRDEMTYIPDLINTFTNKLTAILNDTTEASTSLINNGSAVTSITENTTTENIIRSAAIDVITLPQNNSVIDADLASINTDITGILENLANSTLSGMMLNVTVPIESPNIIGITENIANAMNNVTANIEMHSPTTVTSTATDNLSSVLNYTTEKLTAAVNESVTSVWHTLKHHEDDHLNHYHEYQHEPTNHWLYVLLGIIVAILLLIGIILLLIYIRYRRQSLLPVHNYYEISPMKESCSPLPSHMHDHGNGGHTEFYSQYSN